MQALGVRVVRARFGVVIGQSGGVYPPLAAATRLGLGAILGSGRQPMPWVHLDDAVAAIRFAIDRTSFEGAVNVVAPGLVSQAAFARSLGSLCGTTVRLRVPGRVIRMAGGEAATLLLDGQAATPRRLLAEGYRFKHSSLDSALVNLAGIREATRSCGTKVPSTAVTR